MNWFDVLKEQRQVARTIQSFKPIQFDKPIKIKKPEKTCYEKLLDYCSEHGERRDNDEWFYYFESYGSGIFLPKHIILPDEFYCYALEEFKKFMGIPKKEIKDSIISTKGLRISTTVKYEPSLNYKSMHYSIFHPDEMIISYLYVFGKDEL